MKEIRWTDKVWIDYQGNIHDLNEQHEIILKYGERLQGEWNYIQAGMCVCSLCGAMPHKEYKNFCANCGADMRMEIGE